MDLTSELDNFKDINRKLEVDLQDAQIQSNEYSKKASALEIELGDLKMNTTEKVEKGDVQ